MSGIVKHMNIPAAKCHPPKVDGTSIDLDASNQAQIKADLMVADRVVYWGLDGLSNPTFKTSPVTVTELGYLAGIVPGEVTASRVLAVDSSRNLTHATASKRINNLRITGSFTADSDLSVGGRLVSDLEVDPNYAINFFDGASVRSGYKYNAVDDRLEIGDTSGDLWFNSLTAIGVSENGKSGYVVSSVNAPVLLWIGNISAAGNGTKLFGSISVATLKLAGTGGYRIIHNLATSLYYILGVVAGNPTSYTVGLKEVRYSSNYVDIYLSDDTSLNDAASQISIYKIPS